MVGCGGPHSIAGFMIKADSAGLNSSSNVSPIATFSSILLLSLLCLLFLYLSPSPSSLSGLQCPPKVAYQLLGVESLETRHFETICPINFTRVKNAKFERVFLTAVVFVHVFMSTSLEHVELLSSNNDNSSIFVREIIVSRKVTNEISSFLSAQ